jgi:16S rRNA processing protein RimM
MEEFFRIGVITSTHGIRGEVKVYPTTDDIHRFYDLKECFADSKTGKLALHPAKVRLFKGMVIIGFKEFASIEDAQPYKGCDLLVDRAHALPLEEDEYYISDLIGLKVVTDQGQELGQLSDVMQTGANDVYVVAMPDGREVLLPVIRECILNIDLEAGTVLVHMMPGLMDD